ncbi:Fc receptor-like protein 5 [Electrophorus electricus]|uniref:Fc receptor-like protein 5 n=1 Tax=Electrophorus electricus TaxID=8005 RepID=UPI0015D02F0D|nr:Fc receptor-like protein 5 [Electrophorus electricus]
MDFCPLSVLLSRPKAVASIKPDPQVFEGETVTLRCNIQRRGVSMWRYSWNEEGSLSPVSREQVYTISGAEESHTGNYTCRGTEAGGSRYSHTSDAVRLTVPAVKPKPELTSSPQGAAVMGNPVTLYCKLEQSAGWRFYWSKHTQNPENETNTATRSYTISAVKLSDGGQYWCRAGRGNPVYYTHYSDALWVNITGVSSLVSLIIIPNRTQHFSGHSLSLSCEDQRNSTTWRVMQYSQDRSVSDCPSDRRSVTSSTCNISSLSTAHTGVYWCQSKSGGSSKPVNITVHDGDVILDSPVHPVTEGDSLTLRCLLNKTSSNLISYFYKDGSLFWNQTTGQITIHVISKSDEGLYCCEYPERRASPQSWVSVRVLSPGSNGVIVGPAVGISLTLLLIIILILFLSYKNKAFCSNEHFYLHGLLSSLIGGDLIYANVGNRITDAGAGPSDVTYAQIKMKSKKKPKQTEKTREGTDVMFSELKQKSENSSRTSQLHFINAR